MEEIRVHTDLIQMPCSMTRPPCLHSGSCCHAHFQPKHPIPQVASKPLSTPDGGFQSQHHCCLGPDNSLLWEVRAVLHTVGGLVTSLAPTLNTLPEISAFIDKQALGGGAKPLSVEKHCSGTEVLKMWSLTGNMSHTHVRHANSSSPPDLLNQKLWGWGLDTLWFNKPSR